MQVFFLLFFVILMYGGKRKVYLLTGNKTNFQIETRSCCLLKVLSLRPFVIKIGKCNWHREHFFDEILCLDEKII